MRYPQSTKVIVRVIILVLVTMGILYGGAHLADAASCDTAVGGSACIALSNCPLVGTFGAGWAVSLLLLGFLVVRDPLSPRRQLLQQVFRPPRFA